jgi:xylulokinase
MLFDVAGTAAVLACCTDTYVADVRNRALLTMRSIVPGLWHPLAYIAGGGLALRWYRDQFYNLNRGRPGSLESDLYDEMTRWADQAPAGSDGLFFSPHLGGRICPASPSMRGAWVGFSWGHSQAHFFRAILESVAYEYAYYLGILKDLLPNLSLLEARIVGGGARSSFWKQIKADVLGVPFQSLAGNEFGTWGCALIAGKAAGLFGDLAQWAEQCAIPDGEATRPQQANQAVYASMVVGYIELQQKLNEFFKREVPIS